MKRFMTAEEAARALQVQPATLYAYVSRGLLHSQSDGESRRKLYRRDEVEALRRQRERRKAPEQALATALHWGDPVLETRLSEVTPGGPLYRGQNALELAQRCTFREVVGLLWETDAEALFAAPPPVCNLQGVRGLPPLLGFQALLPVLSAQDERSYDFRPATLHATGVALMRILAALATGHPPATASPAEALQAGWGAPRDVRRWLDMALILCADHELNVSTFTARCVASADAPLYAVVGAAVGAFLGHKHGAQAEKVQAIWAEVQHHSSVRQAVVGRVRRGDPLPGFGHPLYPDGDPRAALLLEMVPVPRARALADTVYELTGEKPNLDFALVALTRHLNLQPHAPATLFALGRMAGWIAHAVEQYGLDRLIRPRARKEAPWNPATLPPA